MCFETFGLFTIGEIRQGWQDGKDHRRFKGNGIKIQEVELEITKHNDLLIGYHTVTILFQFIRAKNFYVKTDP